MSRSQFQFPGIYNSSPFTLSSGDGSALSTDASGNLFVTPAAGASFGSSTADGTAFVQDTTTGGISMGVYLASPQTLTTGDAGAIAVDINRNILVSPSSYATDDSAMPATPKTLPVSGEYRASATTYTDGDATVLQTDSSGNTKVTLATLLAGEDLTVGVFKVEQRFSFLNIVAGQATTVVKSGAGFLHAITFNSAATATNVTTVYDNTAGSGTIIAKPAATTATVPTTLNYDVSFGNGLTIVTATANGSDMTISYR